MPRLKDWIPRLRVLTGDRPNIHVLMAVGTVPPGGNPCEHGENMQNPNRKALAHPRIVPRTFLTVFTTEPPCCSSGFPNCSNTDLCFGFLAHE